jgi:biotin carboxyl carrier protein
MEHPSDAKPRITALVGLVVAAVFLAACSANPENEGTPPTAGQSTTANPGAVGATGESSSTSTGLIQAIHHECDFGSTILRYLATGDNQGDPKLDTAFSQHVGASFPQARAIADQAIERCDAAISKQEEAQASAQAEVSAAAAEAKASAKAAQDKADRLAREQNVCAPLGGTVQDGGDISADLCVSTNKGNATDEAQLSCASATIPFQADGTLSAADIATFKEGYPGCFS